VSSSVREREIDGHCDLLKVTVAELELVLASVHVSDVVAETDMLTSSVSVRLRDCDGVVVIVVEMVTVG